jgi:hypothetical protein
VENLESYDHFKLVETSTSVDHKKYVDLAVDKVQAVLVEYATEMERFGNDYEIEADNLLGMILDKLTGLKSTY